MSRSRRHHQSRRDRSASPRRSPSPRPKERRHCKRSRSARSHSSSRSNYREREKRRRDRKGDRYELWHMGSNSGSGSSFDLDDRDKEGLIDVRPDEYIRDRYKVVCLAGQGTFGTVLDVYDEKHKERIALKVVRSVKRYLKAAYVEVDILEKIRKADVNRDSHIVRLFSTFQIKHNGKKHVCLGFEKLGRSLYDFIKKNKHRGFPLECVRHYGYQLLKAISFCHRIKLIHTDLKPENILLVKDDYTVESKDEDKDYRVPKYNAIRLIDFGGATFEHEHHSKIINTRQYRSPEVLLGLGWSYPSDLWSIGCILPELLTGDLLFRTHEDSEHLALMEHILGKKLPKDLTLKALEISPMPDKGKNRDNGRSQSGESPKQKKKKRARSSSNPAPHELICSDGRLRWPPTDGDSTSKQSIRHVERSKKLGDILPDADLLDLVTKLLEYDQKKRISAEKALEHAFFKPLRDEEELERKEKLRKAKDSGRTSSNSQSHSPTSRSRSRKRERDRRSDRD